MQTMKKWLTTLTILGLTATTCNGPISQPITNQKILFQQQQQLADLFNLKDITAIDAPQSVAAVDQTKVTPDELMVALAPHILAAIQSKVLGVTSDDYLVKLYTIDALGNYNEIVGYTNLHGRGATIYVQITAVDQDQLLSGNSGYIKIAIPNATIDISNISSINDGAYVLNGVDNVQAVRVDEIKNGLAMPILVAVQAFEKDVMPVDFTFTVATKNARGEFVPITEPIDIQHKEVIVYVQITATDESKFISGQTKQLEVRLNATQKLDISTLEISDLTETVAGNILTQDDAVRVQSDVKSTVQQAFDAIMRGIAFDEDYTIANLNQIQAGLTIPNEGTTITVQINVKPDSMLLVLDKTKDVNIILTPAVQKLDVSTLIIPDINETVAGNRLTKDEATKAQNDAINAIQLAFFGAFSGAILYTDYTLANIEAIHEGMQVDSIPTTVTITIKVNPISKVLVADKTKDVNVNFSISV